MAVAFSFTNPNPPTLVEDEIRVYRSTSTMDPEALPAPLATIAAGNLSYTDTTATNGVSYYYRVAFVFGAAVYVSGEVLILAPTDGGVAAWPEITFNRLERMAVVNRSRRTVVGKTASYIENDWYSVRKLALARVVMRYKSAVLTTETVEVTAGDIASASGEFLSGFTAGDLVTWRGMLDLMMVPSTSDVAMTVERVLGGYLLTEFRKGQNAREAIAIAMEEEALLANCNRAIFFGAREVIDNQTVNTPMLISPDDACRLMIWAAQDATLRSIMQQKSISVSVTGPSPKTINRVSIDRNQRNLDFADNALTGNRPRYICGKTGDLSTGFNSHQVFLFETLSGQEAVGCVYNVSGNRFERDVLVAQTQMIAESIEPTFRSSETVADPHAANVALRIKGSAITDTSPTPKTLTNNGVALVSSPYMYSTGMEFVRNDYIEITESMAFGSGDFTIELFLRGVSGIDTDVPAQIFGKWRTDSNASWQLAFEFGSVRFYWSTNGSSANWIDMLYPGQSLRDTLAPNHICVQRSGGDIRLWVNGIPGAMGSISGSIADPTTPKTLLGLQIDTNGTSLVRRFGGIIDEVIVTKGVARYPMNNSFVPVYREMRWG